MPHNTAHRGANLLSNHLCMYRPPTARCEIIFENGDITEPTESTDLLIISAFAGDYTPTRSSVIGALYRKGLRVQSLVRRTVTPNCWISEPDGQAADAACADRILCLESRGAGGSLDELRTLFSVLLTQAPRPGAPAWSIRMPLIGAGDQLGDPERTLKLIVLGFQEAFANGLNVRSIRITVKDADRFRKLTGTFSALCDNYNPFSAEVNPDLKYKLFISYSHKNKHIVRPVSEELRSRIGPGVFVDYDGGVNENMVLSRDLARAVRQSHAMIAFISPEYVASPNCNIEFATAYTLNYLRPEKFSLKTVFLSEDISSFPPECRDVMSTVWTAGREGLADTILELLYTNTRSVQGP
jgi:hypothetical protein